MKPKQKTQNEVPHLDKITGSPGLTAVSDAAQGKKPDTMAEFEDNYHTMWANGRTGGDAVTPKSESSYDTSDIEEAYALLFEGLAMLARSHSQEEDKKEGEAPEQQGCDCCGGDNCDCGDCEDC